MIITKKIEIKINRGNLPFYKKIDNTISIGDTITIDIENLSNGSNLEIEAKCDICDEIVKTTYKQYNKQIKSKSKFTCSAKCRASVVNDILYTNYGVDNIAKIEYIKDKIKETNIKKYGSEYYISSDIGKINIQNIIYSKYGVLNPMHSDKIKNKVLETNLYRYGTKCPLQSEIIKDKSRKTNLNKYGCEYPIQSDDIKDKIKKTNNDRYGGNSPMSDINIKNKSKETLLKNYGVDSPIKNIDIKNKIKNTNIINNGVEYPTQSEIVKNKVKETVRERYGVDYISGNDEIRNKYYKIAQEDNYIDYKSNGVSIFKCDKGLDHFFEIHYDNYATRKKYGIPLCTICNPIGDKKSIREKELFEFIKSIYTGQIVQSYRDGLEIDIYLPDLGLGFEFNGLYWHSNEFKGKYYHLNKINFFKEKGIRIIHIWEDDWIYKNEIVKSQIKNWLKLVNNKIWARKCLIKEVDFIYSSFLNKNHIQGTDKSSKRIGLFYDDELVSLMTFNIFEGRKKMNKDEWNLSRFCSKLDTNVVGGFTRLLKYFIEKYNTKRIVTYADKDWSTGELYYNSNFNFINETKPDYKYIINGRRVHKSRYKNSKINAKESEYIKEKQIYKIWDCGKLKFELIPNLY